MSIFLHAQFLSFRKAHQHQGEICLKVIRISGTKTRQKKKKYFK